MNGVAERFGRFVPDVGGPAVDRLDLLPGHIGFQKQPVGRYASQRPAGFGRPFDRLAERQIPASVEQLRRELFGAGKAVYDDRQREPAQHGLQIVVSPHAMYDQRQAELGGQIPLAGEPCPLRFPVDVRRIVQPDFADGCRLQFPDSVEPFALRTLRIPRVDSGRNFAVGAVGKVGPDTQAADARSAIERPMRVNIYPIGVHVRKND